MRDLWLAACLYLGAAVLGTAIGVVGVVMFMPTEWLNPKGLALRQTIGSVLP